MKNIPSTGILTTTPSSPEAVTRGMLRERAVELAVGNGHSAANVTISEWEQAKRELKGEREKDPNETILEAAPESERWDPVPGSSGKQAPESIPEDEDAEGRTEVDQLVEEGVDAAESEQTLRAAIEANQQDRKDP